MCQTDSIRRLLVRFEHNCHCRKLSVVVCLSSSCHRSAKNTDAVHHPSCVRPQNSPSATKWGLGGTPSRSKSFRFTRNIISVWKCGTWVVVRQSFDAGPGREKLRANCPAPECGKEFEFESGETRVFEVPLPLFERRHFFRSELN